jgi:hypothetical protein
MGVLCSEVGWSRSRRFLQNTAGAAAGKHKVFGELLRGPEAVVPLGMKLAPVDRLTGELGAVRVEDLLQDGVHSGPGAAGMGWGNYTTGVFRQAARHPFL